MGLEFDRTTEIGSTIGWLVAADLGGADRSRCADYQTAGERRRIDADLDRRHDCARFSSDRTWSWQDACRTTSWPQTQTIHVVE